MNIFECAALDPKISEVYREQRALLRSIQPLTLSGLEGWLYLLQDVMGCCEAPSGLKEWKAKWPSGKTVSWQRCKAWNYQRDRGDDLEKAMNQ